MGMSNDPWLHLSTVESSSQSRCFFFLFLKSCSLTMKRPSHLLSPISNGSSIQHLEFIQVVESSLNEWTLPSSCISPYLFRSICTKKLRAWRFKLEKLLLEKRRRRVHQLLSAMVNLKEWKQRSLRSTIILFFLESVYEHEHDVDTLYTLSFGLQPSCLISIPLQSIARSHLPANALILPHAPPYMYHLWSSPLPAKTLWALSSISPARSR